MSHSAKALQPGRVGHVPADLQRHQLGHDRRVRSLACRLTDLTGVQPETRLDGVQHAGLAHA